MRHGRRGRPYRWARYWAYELAWARKGMAGAVSPPARGTPATVEVGNNAFVLGARPRPSALHGSPKSLEIAGQV
jgi:hypothetical protein